MSKLSSIMSEVYLMIKRLKFMKNLKFVLAIVIILAIVNLNACKKLALNPSKSSTIELKAVTNSLNLKAVQDFYITAANVNIVNLQIEENSGNDGENVEGGNENNGNETGGSDNETDNGDVLLAGPYSLDISGGYASIGQVNVYPGTFKKVDFSFQTNTSDPFSGSSIVISGNYTSTDSTVIPFTIYSAFSQKVQLPLADNGIIVTANNSVVIDILFNVNAWLSGIDFASAIVTNNKILIDNAHNNTLLSVFEANLTAYIDIEGE